MEDGIPEGLQHHHKTCCEKDGCYGRQTCMFWRCLHCGDVVSRRVDLYMTNLQLWDSNFTPILLFGVNKYLAGDTGNIMYSLYRIAIFIKQYLLSNNSAVDIS